MRVCTIEGCNRKYYGKGYCKLHYDRMRSSNNEPGPIGLKNRRGNHDVLCSVVGCDRPYVANGYCGLHNRRVRIFGEAGPSGLLNPDMGKPYVASNGYVKILDKHEHRILAERALGRSLPKGVEIHHIDGNKSNNSQRNLVICPNHSCHLLIEMRGRAYEACGHADWVKCRYCLQYDDPRNMFIRKDKRKEPGHPVGWHTQCSYEYSKGRKKEHIIAAEGLWVRYYLKVLMSFI